MDERYARLRSWFPLSTTPCGNESNYTSAMWMLIAFGDQWKHVETIRGMQAYYTQVWQYYVQLDWFHTRLMLLKNKNNHVGLKPDDSRLC